MADWTREEAGIGTTSEGLDVDRVILPRGVEVQGASRSKDGREEDRGPCGRGGQGGQPTAGRSKVCAWQRPERRERAAMVRAHAVAVCNGRTTVVGPKMPEHSTVVDGIVTVLATALTSSSQSSLRLGLHGWSLGCRALRLPWTNTCWWSDHVQGSGCRPGRGSCRGPGRRWRWTVRQGAHRCRAPQSSSISVRRDLHRFARE